MSFRVTGLDPADFRHLYGMSDVELAAHKARRFVNEHAAIPERIEMRDLGPGETALVVNFVHQPEPTPFQASHAVFIREGAQTGYSAVDEIPDVIRKRTISLRAFDRTGMMIGAELMDGAKIESIIDRFFENDKVAYLHAHYAMWGCYAARVDRVAGAA